MIENEKKKFDLREFLDEFKNSITQETKEVILDHEEDFKDIGRFRFMQLMQFISDENESELSVAVHFKLLTQLSDEELLNVKRHNLDGLITLANIKVKRRKIVKDFMSKIGKKAAEIIVQKLLLMVVL